jgi:hypothetical protein
MHAMREWSLTCNSTKPLVQAQVLSYGRRSDSCHGAGLGLGKELILKFPSHAAHIQHRYHDDKWSPSCIKEMPWDENDCDDYDEINCRKQLEEDTSSMAEAKELDTKSQPVRQRIRSI